MDRPTRRSCVRGRSRTRSCASTTSPDRDRFGFRLRSSLLVSERADLGFEIEYGEDSYDETDVGLTASEYTRAGFDGSWSFKGGSVYGAVYADFYDVDQSNSQRVADADWSATTRDRFANATIGVALPEILGLVDTSLEYSWSGSVGETHNDTSGRQSRFPDLRSRRDNVRLRASYPFNDSLTLGFDYLYERFQSDDWALDGVGPTTVSNLLSFGADAFNYTANVFYFSIRYEQPRD